MYVLNLDNDKRILSIWEKIKGMDYGDMPTVNALPNGDVTDYLYIDGEYIYNPLPQPEKPEEQPSQLDMVEAQALYTAMMTDTLLGV